MIKVLSLFSGIGAFEHALKDIGIEFELVNFCEIDKFASQSYCAIHNEDISKNLGDITKINISELKDFDLLTHGSPCQSFSIAGKQGGGDEGSGTRSSLMWNTVEIVRQKKPKYVIWENVKNVLSVNHIHNFNRYIDELDKLGYKSFHKVLNARDFKTPQNRERIFVISILDCKEDYVFPEKQELTLRLKDVLEKEVNEKYFLSDTAVEKLKRHDKKTVSDTNDKIIIDGNLDRKGYLDIDNRVYSPEGISPTLTTNCKAKIVLEGHLYKSNGQSGFVYNTDGIAPTLLSGTKPKIILEGNICKSGGQFGNVYNTDGISPTLCSSTTTRIKDNLRIRRLTPFECLTLQGFTREDFEKLVQAGISDTQMYKQAGNSICVNVLQEVFRQLFKPTKK